MSQKYRFNQQVNAAASDRARDALEQTGKALPCSVVSVSGSIVTVKFEVISGFTLPNVTIPHFGGEWIRYPVQVGDKGVVIPCDARLNDTANIGTGKATMTSAANLTSLIFMPIASTQWTATDDPNKLELYGHDGVIIKQGGVKIIVSAAGVEIFGTVTVHGDVIADGKSLKTHIHSGVQSGGSNTGQPV